MQPIIIKNRRFTCLSPTLVRVEYSPNGTFEDRRSMVAYPEKKPIAFRSVTEDGLWSVLDTGFLQIRTTQNDKACSRTNLEIRWSDGKLTQFWRPGDRDYQNLGGTLRSLDRYGGEAIALDGVHTATMESPDISGTSWPAWIQCEVDPLYTELHPAPPENFEKGYYLDLTRQPRSDGRFMEHSFNWYKDARKFCPGVLSAAGYFLLNDTEGAVLDADDFPIERDRPGSQDWYFFAYGRDYKQALRDYHLLSGPAPIPTHRSFGVIFSRWPAFTEAEISDMVRDFEANGYPLSTLVMDMEWHTEGWGTWDFNPELIPDPARWFALCKKHGLEVSFNDHPLDVRDDDSHFEDYVSKAGSDVEIRVREYNGKKPRMAKVDITNKQQNLAFREVCHTEILKLGLDYWWNDGSRGQMNTTSGQLVTNKTFFETSERDGKRGMLLARYGGLGSHRYGAFFTGDATSDWHVLRLQCEFNIRAAGVGLSHISHDIGGFVLGRSQIFKTPDGKEIIDPIRYLRWLQFGVFGPILRFHSCPGSGSRVPYEYDAELGGACRHWLRVRHSLLPYFYTAAHEFCETGIPLTRGLFLEEPNNPAAYRFDEYWCGSGLLVAPVLDLSDSRTLYLPEGDWWEFDTATKVKGGREITRAVTVKDVPAYVPAGTILTRQNPEGDIHATHIANLILDVYPGANGTASLYEDDGRSDAYKNGHFCKTRFTLEGLRLSGDTETGTPLGATRRITIQIRLDKAPAKITFNKTTALPCESKDGIYTIALPEYPADKPWELVIEE